jgi:stalled ribosome rescue protein Dom34
VNNFVVWIDSKESFIFNLKTTGVEKSHLKKNTSNNHRRHKNDLHEDIHDEAYYKEISQKLNAADKLLILGPGLAKNHFKNYLETHQTQQLDKKVIGIENLEHLTEKQILAKAHDFYKSYHLFHNPL